MWLQLFLAVFVAGTVSGQDRPWVARLTVDNGAEWGSWGKDRFCAEGSYAYAFELKVEPDQGLGDDSSLNSIAILCTDLSGAVYGGDVTSNKGLWGDWRSQNYCAVSGRQMFLTSFSLKVEEDQGLGDDTAANDISFTCSDLDSREGSYVMEGNGGPWGEYGQWSAECPLGTAICGTQTKIEGCSADRTALNDVAFYCCE